jgi:hypothetical protein
MEILNKASRNWQRIDYVPKKWDSMNQEKLEKKLKLEYEAFEHDSRCEEFRNDEKDLILSMRKEISN